MEELFIQGTGIALFAQFPLTGIKGIGTISAEAVPGRHIFLEGMILKFLQKVNFLSVKIVKLKVSHSGDV